MQQPTGELPCRSAISIKLLCNFIEITLRHGCSTVNLLHIFRTHFLKKTSVWLHLESEKIYGGFKFCGLNGGFNPASDDFQIKLIKILYNVEKTLVKLLLFESANVVVNFKIDLNNELVNRNPNDQEEKRIHLSKKRKGYENKLKKQRFKKVEKHRGETTGKPYQ